MLGIGVRQSPLGGDGADTLRVGGGVAWIPLGVPSGLVRGILDSRCRLLRCLLGVCRKAPRIQRGEESQAQNAVQNSLPEVAGHDRPSLPASRELSFEMSRIAGWRSIDRQPAKTPLNNSRAPRLTGVDQLD